MPAPPVKGGAIVRRNKRFNVLVAVSVAWAAVGIALSTFAPSLFGHAWMLPIMGSVMVLLAALVLVTARRTP